MVLAKVDSATIGASSAPPDSFDRDRRAPPVIVSPVSGTTLTSPNRVASSIVLVTPVTGASASIGPSERLSRARL